MTKQKNKTKKEIQPTDRDVLTDPDFKDKLRGAYGTIKSHSQVYQEAMGLSKEDAEKRIAQLYFESYKLSTDALATSRHILAMTMMGMEMKMEMDPTATLANTKEWAKLLEEARKSTKLMLDAEGKKVSVTHNIQKDEDSMVFDWVDTSADEVNEDEER